MAQNKKKIENADFIQTFFMVNKILRSSGFCSEFPVEIA